MIRNISVFEPQEINGQIIEPICIPSEPTALAHTVAGATNLLWFAFHLALAEGNIGHCKAISKMLQVVVEGEISEEFKQELEAAIDLLDKQENDDTESDDEN